MTYTMLLVLLFAAASAGSAQVAHYRADGPAKLPDPVATPGATRPGVTAKQLCDPKFHTGTVRDVPEAEKKQTCANYGVPGHCWGRDKAEEDHLISLEIGGSNDLKNIWPQPADRPGAPGYQTKDELENRLHRLVCANKMTLTQAQRCISEN